MSKPLLLEPKIADFGGSLIRGLAFAPKTISVRAQLPLSSLRAECKSESLTAEVIQHAQDTSKFNIVVSAQSGKLSAGFFESSIQLHCTSDAGESIPPVRLPVVALVREQVEIVPANHSFGSKRLGDTGKETFYLRSLTGSAFDVDDIEYPSAELTVTALPIADAGKHGVAFLISVPIKSQRTQRLQVVFTVSTREGARFALPLSLEYFGIE